MVEQLAMEGGNEMGRIYDVPYGLDVTVEIVTEPDGSEEGHCKRIVVYSPLYMKKQYKLPHCYSTTFTDDAILNDSGFIGYMVKAFGMSLKAQILNILRR